MALAQSGRAIGAVTQLLHDTLMTRLSTVVTDVTVGRPEPPKPVTETRLNLFLYEVHFDESLKNHALDDGQAPPLWLVLRYLLTAFDQDGESDSIAAHEVLGQGMQVLQDINFVQPNPLPPSLDDIPDLLKLTFEESTSDLLSRLMQGADEKYRCSVAFQVRPVLIAPGLPPSYGLLVGVDYTTAPATTIGERGIHNLVLPTLGPVITSVAPEKFAVGSDVELQGTDLNLGGLSVRLGPVELPVVAQRPDRLSFRISPSLNDGTAVSAGSHPLAVVQALPNGRVRSSNLLIGALLPELGTALASGLVHIDLADPTSPVRGTLDLTGHLLGTADDDVFVAFHGNGRVVAAFDELVPMPGPPQTARRLVVALPRALPADTYRIVLRVNGQQALASPQVTWVP